MKKKSFYFVLSLIIPFASYCEKFEGKLIYEVAFPDRSEASGKGSKKEEVVFYVSPKIIRQEWKLENSDSIVYQVDFNSGLRTMAVSDKWISDESEYKAFDNILYNRYDIEKKEFKFIDNKNSIVINSRGSELFMIVEFSDEEVSCEVLDFFEIWRLSDKLEFDTNRQGLPVFIAHKFGGTLIEYKLKEYRIEELSDEVFSLPGKPLNGDFNPFKK